MTSQQQKKQMLDYLVSKLEGSNPIIEPNAKEIVSGIVTNYIKIGEKCKDGIVLLVDQIYPNDAFNEIYCKARTLIESVGVVFFKDGTIFFRSAAEKNYKKLRKDRSLKNYSEEELHRMINFRPEEKFLYRIRQMRGGWLQYYQPQSERLPEGLVSFRFGPVYYDYRHINESERFKPEDTDSKKLHIWNNKIFCDKELTLENGYLVSRKEEQNGNQKY